ncbi:MAG: hypothetical protein K9N23_07900 [Akkermansiaceae bacterium]|nr:hypothetical protein [Akkermansiaceae bacterium]
MVLKDGYFRIAGRPVFPAGLNMVRRGMVDLSRHPEWAERDETMLGSFLGEMREIGVGVVGQGISLPGLLTKDGSIRSDGIREIVEGINDLGRRGFKAEGVLLICLGDRKPSRDAHGLPHAPETLRFLDDVPMIGNAPAPDLSRRIGGLLSPVTDELPLRIQRVDRPDAFGVMSRQVEMDGRQMVILINVLSREIDLRLTTRKGAAVRGLDLLQGEAIDGDRITMPVEGVRLIRIAPDP